MKKNFFQIVLGALVLTLGFSSCKKDDKKNNCVDCATFTDDYGTYTYCVGDGSVETQAKFDAYVAQLKADGYTVKTSEKCE
jgi:hypothetical protein